MDFVMVRTTIPNAVMMVVTAVPKAVIMVLFIAVE